VESARLVTAADLSRLTALWQQASAELSSHRGGSRLVGATSPPWLERPDDRSDQGRAGPAGEQDPPLRRVVVGCLDEEVVGFAWASIRQAVAVVEAIYVEAAARGVGVGEALIDDLVAWATLRSCVALDAFALPGSRPAKAFFEGSGFVTRLLVMSRPLVGSPFATVVEPGSSPAASPSPGSSPAGAAGGASGG